MRRQRKPPHHVSPINDLIKYDEHATLWKLAADCLEPEDVTDSGRLTREMALKYANAKPSSREMALKYADANPSTVNALARPVTAPSVKPPPTRFPPPALFPRPAPLSLNEQILAAELRDAEQRLCFASVHNRRQQSIIEQLVYIIRER